MRKEILLKEKDVKNILSLSELVVDLTLRLKGKLVKRKIFLSDDLLYGLLKDNTITYLLSKKKFRKVFGELNG